ncbi:Protein SMG9 (Protein smg-9 homolog) [Durusdinium trenchii]|uniref:Protein SMG9 (Protein smg-9 homolog) n=1 Tax=Durusdinium trenchii TaxID=1381693 RepID=A0ABP0IJD4_9DINO
MPERRSTRHETTSRSSREKSGGAKKDVKEKRPTGQAFTRCRFMDDEWRICGDEVSPWLLETHDFLVVATLGAQKVGRSTVLSTLLSPFFHADGPSAANFQVPLGIHTAESFLEGQSSPGVDMCITMDRLLLLDAQPLFESSADLPSELCLMIFLASICHCILVVTDTALDPELWRFLRLLATLKAKVPDLASWLKTQANEASTPKEAFPHLLVVFNNMEEDEELHEPMEDFLKYTAWKAAPSIRCVTVPHLPGLSAEEMLCSAQAAELGRSLRQELFHEGSAAPGGFGGLQLTEKQWLNHLLEYWDFVQKRSEIQSYFDLPMAGRLKSLDSPDPKS